MYPYKWGFLPSSTDRIQHHFFNNIYPSDDDQDDNDQDDNGALKDHSFLAVEIFWAHQLVKAGLAEMDFKGAALSSNIL